MGIRCDAYAPSFYPQKLAVASPESDRRSAVIVHLRTKSRGVYFVLVFVIFLCSYGGFINSHGASEGYRNQ
jgi:hypothetical protein